MGDFTIIGCLWYNAISFIGDINMPLCTLELSPNYLSYPKAFKDPVGVCNRALDRALEVLEVPDPDDREYRVLVRGYVHNPRLKISFTRGTDEYETGEIFNPSNKLMLATGIAVQALVSTYGVSRTRMEAWEDTTFLVRSTDHPPVSVSTPKLEPKNIQPRVTLTVSRAGLERFPDVWRGENIGVFAQGLLGLVGRGEINLLKAHLAETDYAVEVDFPKAKDNPLSPEDRLELARKIEAFFNRQEETKKGSATIWIRQGQPTVRTLTQNFRSGCIKIK